MFSFLLAFLLVILQIPLKTLQLTLQVANGVKPVQNLKSRLGLNSLLGESASKVSGAAGKAGKTVVKISDKVLKYTVRFIKWLLLLLKSAVVLLCSLGVVGVLFFIVVVLVVMVSSISIALLFSDVKFTNWSMDSGSSNISESTYNPVDFNVDTSSLMSCLETMANWYIANVSTYQRSTRGNRGTGARQNYYCSLVGGDVGDDCTGFSAAYASLVSGKYIGAVASSGMYPGTGVGGYTKAGWTRYTIAELGGVDGLLPGDILVCNDGADANTKGHHAEIFIDKNTSFGWGQIQDKYPSCTVPYTDTPGLQGYIDCGSYHRYGVVYRFTGTIGGENNNGS